jgi:hypothetical protein
MANEGHDDYRPDGKKIDLFEDLAKRLQRQSKSKSKRNGQRPPEEQEEQEQLPEKRYDNIITFEQWQTKLVQKYNTLYNVVKENLPHLWPSLEFDLSVKAILHVKDITLPFAGIVLGKPSSLKTVGLEMFRKSTDVYYTDNFTAKSFVSHNSGVSEERLQQIDLLPKIRPVLL